jgi:MoaA/NifB/PqqE/SkfB family radical SAM enzyme
MKKTVQQEQSTGLLNTYDLFGDHVIDRNSATCAADSGAEFFMQHITGPVTVAWNVTESCNLRCLHCFNNSGPLKKDELTHDEAMRLVDEIIDMGVFNVCVCGGEPMLRKDLFEIIRRFTDNDIMVSMVSNGWLIDKAAACALSECGVRFLQISIDGTNAESHELLRGRPGAFERAVNAAKHVAETDIELAVAFCPTRFNIHEFDDYVDMCHQIGAKMIRMMPLLSLGRTLRNKDKLLPSAEQVIKFVWTVNKKGLDYVDRGLSVEWGDPLEHLYLFPYNQAKLFILEIHANGDLGISAYLPLIFGNVRDGSLKHYWEKGLKDAWRHPATLTHAKKIITVDDLQKNDILPWEGGNVFVNLETDTERIIGNSMNETFATQVGPFRAREELNGIRSIFPYKLKDSAVRAIRQVHFLNRTGAKIFELCNGENSSEDIIRVMHSRFPTMDSEVLEKDVLECLHNMRNLGLIDWEEECDQPKKGIYARIAEEKDIKDISDFVIQRLNGKKNNLAEYSYQPVCLDSYYSPIAIRVRSFHNKEIYSLLTIDGKIRAVASLGAMGPPLKSSQISMFLVDSIVSDTDANTFMEFQLSMIEKLELSKLKCGITPETSKPAFINFLKNNQFRHEATLKSEMGHGKDVVIFSRLLVKDNL